MNNNQIIWHQLPNESSDERIVRLNKDLHRIFFDGKEVCPASFLDTNEDGFATCLLCNEVSSFPIAHATPRFLESLDAMQFIVESGKFAEVREEYFHWLAYDGKPAHECTIMLYGKLSDKIYFREKGNSRQEAFYLTALLSQGYTVIKEEQGGL
jgi:hypothetical protein